MYYDIFLNGQNIGTFGHSNIENASFSVSGEPNGMYIMANATCLENNKRYHYFWIQKDITPTDEVLITPSSSTESDRPLKKVEMGRSARSSPEDMFCDFCKRKESEVERLIPGGADRPAICSDCVELYNRMLNNKNKV